MSQQKTGQGATDSAGQNPKNKDGNMQRNDQMRDKQHATEHGDREKNKSSGGASHDRDRASDADRKGGKS